MQTQAPKLVRSIISNSVLKRKYHDVPNLPTVSYNQLASPSGCWKTQYDANQRKFNAHLVFGIGFCIGSIVFGKASGLLYLNHSPPARPADKNDYTS